MNLSSKPQSARILLVDDDPQALESTRKILEFSEYDVTSATDGQMALEQVRKSRFDLVITDVRMPKMGGLEFLKALSLCGETTPVILMTAFGRVEDAVWAMKFGAVDFLTKPFKRQALISAAEAALKRARAAAAAAAVQAAGTSASNGPPARPGAPASKALFVTGGETLLGTSAPIQKIRDLIAQVARTSANVLLTGESGTGKELVAKRIHQQSPRASGRFIAINCAAVPENLMESELFGFEKGSFSGAHSAKEGLFEAAHGGTLLLDEIGDMPLSLQVKLLRTLQEGEVRRLGSTFARKFDVRIIAATHRDLKEGARAGTFRQDLLYRLEVVGLEVPPLRARMEDLPELARHFVNASAQRHDKPVAGVSAEAMEILLKHSWPGNVRELSNVIERAIVFASGEQILPADLPPHLQAIAAASSGAVSFAPVSGSGSTISVRVGTPLKEVEELLIRKTLEATSGDKNMTAKLLGINSRTIYRKLDTKKQPGAEGGEEGLLAGGEPGQQDAGTELSPE